MDALQIQEPQLPQIKMWNNQRVVTFKDIDSVHERPYGTAKRNFNRNKKFFVADVDYFEVPYSEFSTNFVPNQTSKGGNPNNEVVLLTETGYLMVVKSLKDDLSWTVQRQLVNGYFKAQEQKQQKPKQLEDLPPWELGTSAPQWPTPPERIWYNGNKPKINQICKEMNISHRTLFHRILTELGNWYDIKDRKELYKATYGIYPRYNMDLLDEFEDMEEVAENYLEFLENSLQNYRPR